MAQEMFQLPAHIEGCPGTPLAVSFNPGGRFHGWLFGQHPDGGWVSMVKLEAFTPNDITFSAAIHSKR